MKYPRYKYLDPAVEKTKVIRPFTKGEIVVPLFETPITPKENFIRAARRDNPLWVPNMLTDVQWMMPEELISKRVDGRQLAPSFTDQEERGLVYTDWFGASWTWVPTAGGPMLTPGTCVCDDITQWERIIKFPDLSQWGFEERAEDYLKTEYDPNRALSINIFLGCTERLVSVMGGYTESMMALVVEPEAIVDFFERYADHVIELFDKVYSLYPVDMVTLHDDWGTEKDTFFSAKMLEELVYAPTKRIVDHIKSKGIIFELHSCGNVERFLPYMVSMGIDFLQLQRRAVDIPKLKTMYGDKIGFNVGLEGIVPGVEVPVEELIESIHKTVDTYASGGGFYASIFEQDPARIWNALSELYSYGREFYDNERLV